MRMMDYLRRYGHTGSRFTHRLTCYHQPTYEELVLDQLSKLGKGKKILDVGCRNGEFSRTMMDQYHDVWGVEADAEAAQSASEQGVRVKVVPMDEGLPFDSSSFDGIHAQDVVEHLFDTKAFFLDCQRVLKKNGFFIFTVPNLNSVENRFRVLTGQYLSNLGAYPEDHFGQNIRVFNQLKVKELCEQTGFHIDEILGVFLPVGRNFKIPDQIWNLSVQWVAQNFQQFAPVLLIRARKSGSV